MASSNRSDSSNSSSSRSWVGAPMPQIGGESGDSDDSGSGGSFSWWPPFNSSSWGYGGGGGWGPFPAGYGGGGGNSAAFGGGGGGSGGGVGAGTIVLVAVLVTGFTLLSLLLLRLWLCGCSHDDDARAARRAAAVAAAASGTNPVAKAAPPGLRKDVIDSFQVVTYRALASLQHLPPEGANCAVCISDFGDEDSRIRVLPGCAHCFHPECVDLWLAAHASCPVCRRDLLQSAADPLAQRQASARLDHSIIEVQDVVH